LLHRQNRVSHLEMWRSHWPNTPFKMKTQNQPKYSTLDSLNPINPLLLCSNSEQKLLHGKSVNIAKLLRNFGDPSKDDDTSVETTHITISLSLSLSLSTYQVQKEAKKSHRGKRTRMYS
jgi:hypothetical protein